MYSFLFFIFFFKLFVCSSCYFQWFFLFFVFFCMAAVIVGASLEVEHASHAPIVCDSHFPTRITDL